MGDGRGELWFLIWIAEGEDRWVRGGKKNGGDCD